jgi:hypothetical protein
MKATPRFHSVTLGLLAGALFLAPAAQADFGFLPADAGFKVTATGQGGDPARLAGSHPYDISTEVNFELAPASEHGIQFTDGDLKDLSIDLPPGLVENPTAVSRCAQELFHTPRDSPFEATLSGESCPVKSQIGTIELRTSFGGGSTRTFGVFNLIPPPGSPSQFGAAPYGAPITITPRIRETGAEYGVTLDLKNFPQQLDTYGFTLTLWGTPWSVAHDGQRGNCLNGLEPNFAWARCPVGGPVVNPRQAYLTLPASCTTPIAFNVTATSWQQPGTVKATSQGKPLQECESLGFGPDPLARLNTDRAGSPSGFDFTLQGDSEGLTDPERRASSQIKKAVITMPEGMTVNPSLGAGLGVCTPERYAAETLNSPPGAGCPNVSRIGEMTVKSPLFEGEIKGGLFSPSPTTPKRPAKRTPSAR